MEQKMDVMLNLLVLLSPVIVILIGWVSKKLAAYLGVRIENEKVEGVLLRSNDLIWTLVLNAEQTTVKEVMAAKAKGSDGGEAITKAEAEQIKFKVMEQFKVLAGPKGLAEIMKVLGLETPELLTDWLGSKLESAVATKNLMKTKGTVERLGDAMKADFR